MKCPNCGFENKENARYCIKCGTALKRPENSEYIHIAFLYTANQEAAETIASKAVDSISLRKACIDWIYAHDPSLFKDVSVPDESAILHEINDWDSDLISMDYEERICTIMHIYEGMKIDEIASELNISSNQVKAELQSACRKVTPAEQITIPIKQIQQEKKEKKHFDAKKMRQTFMFSLLGVLVVILGIFFGVRNYAHSEYQKGMDELKQGQYEEAVDSLSHAIRFGYEEDAEKQLGNAYSASNDTDNALTAWHTYYEEHPDDSEVKKSLISTYEKLADQKLDEGAPNDARDYLTQEYEINPCEFVNIRIKAIDNSGICRIDDNNEFNSYGQPVRLSTDVYTVTLTYNSSHQLVRMTASDGVSGERMIYNRFDFSQDGTLYGVEWKPDGDLVSWRADQMLYQNGALIQENISLPDVSYTREYSDSGYTDSEGNTVLIEKTMDDQNRTASEKDILGSETITERNYSYNNSDDTYAEMDVTSTKPADPTELTPLVYVKQAMVSDAVRIYQQRIMNAQKTVIGYTWYIPYNGTVTLYIE